MWGSWHLGGHWRDGDEGLNRSGMAWDGGGRWPGAQGRSRRGPRARTPRCWRGGTGALQRHQRPGPRPSPLRHGRWMMSVAAFASHRRQVAGKPPADPAAVHLGGGGFGSDAGDPDRRDGHTSARRSTRPAVNRRLEADRIEFFHRGAVADRHAGGRDPAPSWRGPVQHERDRLRTRADHQVLATPGAGCVGCRFRQIFNATPRASP